jgi:asparagine synthase (glutamine-hydrolysing)
MCGIAGLLAPATGWDGEALARHADAMARALARRGPDGQGVWTDAETGVALAHRRLSILDLSPAGAQPMMSADGRWVVSYNGEVYNTPELAAELRSAGVVLRGHSDTEVILELCARLGVEETLRRLAGMFALAFWDRRERVLWLARDRLGIKPLAWWRMPDGGLAFASEIGAFAPLPQAPADIDPAAVAALLRLGAVPAPITILAGVSKLAPGGLLRAQAGQEPRLSAWWDPATAAAAQRAARRPDDSAQDLEALLERVVGQHLLSDVPVGAFLSGGIDSSLVVAMMCRVAPGAVRTFSIGFDVPGYDEAGHARAVAARLGTEHTELAVGEAEALAVVPRLAGLYDEPFADASQIPTVLLAELTRRSVTVALSGDGGDELFAGYNRHRVARRLWPRVAGVPRPLRHAAAGLIRLLSPERWDGALRAVSPGHHPPQAGEKLHKLARVLDQADPDGVYAALVAQWPDPRAVSPRSQPTRLSIDGHAFARALADPVERMQFLDLLCYLPDDILVKVDRASMAVGLEARVPLLDHRVLERSWRLSPDVHFRDGRGKWPLRRILAPLMPEGFFERPKSGFTPPLHAWLRGPLRDWAQALLDPGALRDDGWFDPAAVTACWRDHLSGRANHQYRLWPILMMRSWSEARRG